jgi:hypothetical protein
MIYPARRAMMQSLGALALIAATLAASPAGAAEFNLSKDDVAFLQQIARQDDFVRNLIESDRGLAPLRETLAIIPAAPTKVVMDWNQSMIRGWRRTNTALDARNKAKICDSITEFTSNTKNATFFFQLYEARGCAD